jgi:hypothetical protein
VYASGFSQKTASPRRAAASARPPCGGDAEPVADRLARRGGEIAHRGDPEEVVELRQERQVHGLRDRPETHETEAQRGRLARDPRLLDRDCVSHSLHVRQRLH